MDGEETPQDEMAKLTVGQRLRAAREEKGATLADIAAKTRVPQRLLDALERDAVDELPVGPYATGFARSFAEAVGLNPTEVVADVRALRDERMTGLDSALDHYAPADESRVPPRRLAIIAFLIFLALLGGYFGLRAMTMAPAGGDSVASAPAATEPETPSPAAGATPAASPAASAATQPAIAFDANARLIVKATSEVWFSLEDANGRSQFDLTLQGGEFYTIRSNQRGLRLRTGKPQALRVVVGEQELPQLGPNDTIVSGVALDLANLGRIAAGGAAMAAPTVPAAGTPTPAPLPTAP
ncbi:MAG: helix-turn-helix domain-containing protein [Sphingopyxis sp.]|jgi:cytoskeletal protein RodZ|nr:helix-turn-helix domain-containing protein [Sphingopyxis sp.]